MLLSTTKDIYLVMTGYLEYNIDNKTGLLYSTWTRPVSSLEFREGTMLLLDLVNRHGIGLWLCDSRSRDALQLEDRAWLKATYIYQIRGSSLRKFATVPSLDVLLESEAYMLISYLNVTLNFLVQHEYHDTLEGAFAWLFSDTPEQLCEARPILG